MAEIYRALINKGFIAAVCHICGKESVPLAFDHGIGVWVSPFDLVRTVDRTSEVVDKFNRALHWRIEYQKATCPECLRRMEAHEKSESHAVEDVKGAFDAEGKFHPF